MATQFEKISVALTGREVQYVIIGGWAAIFHGSARATMDVDIVYARSRENIRRLVEALRPLNPYLRGAPPGLPFSWDETTVRNGLNFTLTTSLGELDALGEVPGGGTYENLLPYSVEMASNGMKFRCVTLERLIQLKRAAGRPKDLEAVAELQSLLDERKRAKPG